MNQKKHTGNTSKQEGIQGDLGRDLNRNVYLTRYSRTSGGTEKPNSSRADFPYRFLPRKGKQADPKENSVGRG
jgi:hypothetical protein